MTRILENRPRFAKAERQIFDPSVAGPLSPYLDRGEGRRPGRRPSAKRSLLARRQRHVSLRLRAGRRERTWRVFRQWPFGAQGGPVVRPRLEKHLCVRTI
jgi:hypothetical protein